ncbi:MAG: hypothetical protein GF313_12625 [Caldithrix sp.]|nr:hypothetical protein [Caldithrix sp.]
MRYLKSLTLSILTAFIFTACYTQFAVVERHHTDTSDDYYYQEGNDTLYYYEEDPYPYSTHHHYYYDRPFDFGFNFGYYDPAFAWNYFGASYYWHTPYPYWGNPYWYRPGYIGWHPYYPDWYWYDYWYGNPVYYSQKTFKKRPFGKDGTALRSNGSRRVTLSGSSPGAVRTNRPTQGSSRISEYPSTSSRRSTFRSGSDNSFSSDRKAVRVSGSSTTVRNKTGESRNDQAVKSTDRRSKRTYYPITRSAKTSKPKPVKIIRKNRSSGSSTSSGSTNKSYRTKSRSSSSSSSYTPRRSSSSSRSSYSAPSRSSSSSSRSQSSSRSSSSSSRSSSSNRSSSRK